MNPPSSVNATNLRAEIDRRFAAGQSKTGMALLGELWKISPGLPSANFVLSRFERARKDLEAAAKRVAVVRSFTVEPVVSLLRAAAAVRRIDLQVQVGEFNAYAQEILDPSSSLYSFAPDVVILAVQLRDIAPELVDQFTTLSPQEISQSVKRISEDFQNWIRAFRQHSQASLIIHSLELPAFPSQGILDGQVENGQTAAIQQINSELGRCARNEFGVYILDYDALAARHGREHWTDPQNWLGARLPLSGDCLIHLANEWLRFIQPLSGRVCKALVVDLDNTLWGGVVGEDGPDRVALSAEYPGAAYRELQKTMLDLYHRGILLAICSKNNQDDALQVLREHPQMVLRPEHFAAMRINWAEKSQNLIEIAGELNIGVDALAFLDDNPAEREHVRLSLPEVTIIDLPQDPMCFARALRQCPAFERLSLSSEDRERGRHYVEQRQRLQFQESATSLEDFYRSLQQELEIAAVTAKSLPRAAQLTQKTNQFNLTTRRYSEQQMVDMLADPKCRVLGVNVHDRFGDNGMVGVMIARDCGDECEIDTFLLSCRVIGRTVETAMLACQVAEAQARGLRRLKGWFLPTKKNAPAKDFYSAHGFALLQERQDGSLWELDLSQAQIKCPEWITFTRI